MLYVIPTAGLCVPDPAFAGTPMRHLPPEGRLVQESEYWTRRLRDGDVAIGEPPVEVEAGLEVAGDAAAAERTPPLPDAELHDDDT